MDRERILAFRLARSGLARRAVGSLAEAAAPPASDFAHDAALQALAARREGLTREIYETAVDDADEIVVAHLIRGAIHALRAAAAALAGGRALSKNELHEELRTRVAEKLLPWCKGCQSHHVASMLWRYGVVQAGVRLDSERRYLLADSAKPPPPAEAVRRFLAVYGPATAGDFGEWAGIADSHAARLWAEVEDDLIEVRAGRQKAWILEADAAELKSPPKAQGVFLIAPGDPYLGKVNRPLLAPDPKLRKRLFRPVASPGAVLKAGRLVGLWRARSKGKALEVTVEKLGRVARDDLTGEAERVAALRGSSEAVLVVD